MHVREFAHRLGPYVSRRMGRIKNRLSSNSYGIARYFGLRERARAWRCGTGRTPILIYTMGKVGTTTVVNSLKQSLSSGLVYHLHTLSDGRLASEEMVYRKNFPRIRTIHDHLLNSRFLRRKMDKAKRNGHRWQVVTLIRDPIARNISAFFQGLDLHFKDLGFADRIRSGGDDRLLSDMTEFLIHNWDHMDAIKWFDREMKGILGVDVPAEEFSVGLGYQTYRGNFADVLLLRLEDLGRCAATAISQFLGIESFQLIRRQQESGKKYYAEMYRRFKSQLALPESILDAVYQTDLVQKLYSSEEISAFRRRWGSMDNEATRELYRPGA